MIVAFPFDWSPGGAALSPAAQLLGNCQVKGRELDKNSRRSRLDGLQTPTMETTMETQKETLSWP